MKVAVQAKVKFIYRLDHENVAKQVFISCRHCECSTNWPDLIGWLCYVSLQNDHKFSNHELSD